MTKSTITKPTRLLGLIAVLVLTFSSGALALTPRQFVLLQSQFQIQSQLPSGVTINNASDSQLLAATTNALNLDRGLYRPGVSPASLVTVASQFRPKLAAQFEGAGLTRVRTFTYSPVPAVDLRLKQLQASNMVEVAMAATLFQPGITNPTNGAAVVTSYAVNAVVDRTNANNPTDPQNLLATVVASAVRTAAKFGGIYDLNGAGGAVTGGIVQVSGSNNETITNSDANDILVKTVISAAVLSAPARLAQIAKGVGFAFAGTYLKTAGSSAVNADKFASDNFVNGGSGGLFDAILDPILSSVRARPGVIAAIRAQLRAFLTPLIRFNLQAGISLAYAGAPGGYSTLQGPGVVGVGGFAFNNGNNPPVTDAFGG